MKKLLTIILLMGLPSLLLVSCSNRSKNLEQETADSSQKNDLDYQSYPSNGQSPSISAIEESVRDIKIPSDFVGSPDRICIRKGTQENIYESGTDEYNEIITILRDRFPEKLKEAATAILWSDENGLNWDLMADEFDYLRLTYDSVQTVKMNCMNNNDQSTEELSFYDMIFPLSSEYCGVVIVDTSKTSDYTGKTFGPLDESSEIITGLLGYME